MQFKKINWSDVSIRDFQELHDIMNATDLTPTGFVLEVADLFHEFDDDLSEKDLKNLKDSISFVSTPCKPKAKDSVNGKPMMQFSRMPLSNFIELDVTLVKNDFCDALPICAQIIYDLGDEVFDLPVTDVIGAVLSFAEYRQNVYSKYPNVFMVDDEDDIDETDDVEADEPKQDVATGWLKIVFLMAEGDLTKYNDIISSPHILVFNWASLSDSLKSKKASGN